MTESGASTSGAEAVAQPGPLPATVPDDYYDLRLEQPSWADGLSDRDRRWVDAYVASGFNAAKASREVGLSESTGARLKRDPRVVRAIEAMLQETGAGRARVLEELGALAFSSLADVVEWKDGKLTVRDAASLPNAVKRSLTRVECDPETGVVSKVAMDLKGPALTLLAKALRLTGADTAISVQNAPINIVMMKEDQDLL